MKFNALFTKLPRLGNNSLLFLSPKSLHVKIVSLFSGLLTNK